MAGKFKIGGKLIGRHREPFLIAEAGINHFYLRQSASEMRNF